MSKAFIDGREFDSRLEASMHLLWLIQRLCYGEGRPADGPRFRDAILEARKLIDLIEYEPGKPIKP